MRTVLHVYNYKNVLLLNVRSICRTTKTNFDCNKGVVTVDSSDVRFTRPAKQEMFLTSRFILSARLSHLL